jgi:hypothetical protein
MNLQKAKTSILVNRASNIFSTRERNVSKLFVRPDAPQEGCGYEREIVVAIARASQSDSPS